MENSDLRDLSRLSLDSRRPFAILSPCWPGFSFEIYFWLFMSRNQIYHFHALLLILCVFTGCGKQTPSKLDQQKTPANLESLSAEEKAKVLDQAQANYEFGSKLFNDLVRLRLEIQLDIGKAKAAGADGTTALVELRNLLKEVDTEIVEAQIQTAVWMLEVRKLQKIESVPMGRPEVNPGSDASSSPPPNN